MKKLTIIAIIPSRMGSSRFPGKPLENILGLPMIEHVRRRVERVGLLDEVFVATCDNEIKEVVEKNGGKVIMTADSHERCTDRIEEAAHSIDADIIVNIQGDEPMVSREAIEEVIAPFAENSEVLTTCLVYPIRNRDELDSLNIVKVVLNQKDQLLYLSRSIIPGREYDAKFSYYKQSGIMAFRKDFLHTFHRLKPTPLESKESVDMLRVLEHGYPIQGVVSCNETIGVDIPDHIHIIEEQILKSEKEMKINNQILGAYNE